jgi:hypothetical protein
VGKIRAVPALACGMVPGCSCTDRPATGCMLLGYNARALLVKSRLLLCGGAGSGTGTQVR